MDERAALDVTAVRAVETSDRARSLWSDADRAWASRAAAEIVGADARRRGLPRAASDDGPRAAGRADQGAAARAAGAAAGGRGSALLVVAAAFVLGFALDRIGDAGRVNILAPPVLGLRRLEPRRLCRGAGGLRRALRRRRASRCRCDGRSRGWPAAACGRAAMRRAPSPHWRPSGRSSPRRCTRPVPRASCTSRPSRSPSACSPACTCAASRYEYRAGWESTFLSAPTVHSIARIAYAPGAAVTGIAVPDVAAIEAIRAPAGENAARWLHLMAATVVVLVVLPRLLLVLATGLVERHRARNFPLPLDEPYFRRLLRGYRGGPARVRVLPYSYTLPAEAAAGLEAIVSRGFGGSAALHVAAPVPYGGDAPPAGGEADGTTFAVFGGAATPEPELHGRFLATLERARHDRAGRRGAARRAGLRRETPGGAARRVARGVRRTRRCPSSSPTCARPTSSPSSRRSTTRWARGRDAERPRSDATAMHAAGQSHRALAHLAHERRQDHARAHAARPRRGRGARRGARHRSRRPPTR